MEDKSIQRPASSARINADSDSRIASINEEDFYDNEQGMYEKSKLRIGMKYDEEKDNHVVNQPKSADKNSDTEEMSLDEPTAPKQAQKQDDWWKWVIFAAAFFTLVCIDGVAFSFGVLGETIAREFRATQIKTSIIGSMFIALPLIIGPIISALVDRYGCRVLTMVAGLATTCALLLSAACSSVSSFLFAYGVFGGLTVAILYVTSIVSVSLWFNEKRNLVPTFISSSFGVGPLIFSPLIEYLLKTYTLSEMLLVVGGIVVHVCVCGALMRNPLYKEDINKGRPSPNSAQNLSLGSLASAPISADIACESKSSSSSEVTINKKYQVEYNKDTAVLPVSTVLKEPTTLGPEKHDEGNKHKIEITKPILNDSNEKKKNQNKLKLRKVMITDSNYLKRISLYRHNMLYRGAMTSIPKYKLRSTLRPDVYSNSCWSLNSEAGREHVPWLRIWMTPNIAADDFRPFTRIHFILFNLSVFHACAWSIFPYFFLKPMIDREFGDGGTTIICVIAVASIVGTVLWCWAQEQPWMNAMGSYRVSLIICGCVLLTYPLLFKYYSAIVFVSMVFGVAIAGFHGLTSAILMDLVPMESFTMGYCIVLMVQGLGYLIGPPIGGMLYDATGKWGPAFWLGGSGLILSGILAWLVKAPPAACGNTSGLL